MTRMLNTQDYYPFGSLQPGRNWNSDQYRFGFNGKENDNEVKGIGNQQDYGMRIYDPRLGRFLSADPLIVKMGKYPELTPYQFASNTPIQAIDMDGLEAYFTSAGKFDRWGSIKGADAPVIIIEKAGDVNGTTLKNNATDFAGQDITVQQFLRRAQRVYGEGGTEEKFANAYAHAQDNVREACGGSENANYAGSGNKISFDVNNIGGTYDEWNKKRGSGYNDLSGLNSLPGANSAIAAEAKLLMGKTTDPTNGATQWVGTKPFYDFVLDLYQSQKVVPTNSMLGPLSPGNYITNATFWEEGGFYHVFYNYSSTPEEKPQYQWSSGTSTSGTGSSTPVSGDYTTNPTSF